MSKQTPLYQAHLDSGAKMGPFAGYDMPLYYGEGVMAEHEWVREHAGIFDVSHMGQVILSGENAMAFLERITPSSFGKLPDGRAKYTVMTNDKGGIVDDLIVTRMASDQFFAVINAGCKDKDIAWMREHLPSGVDMQVLDDRALVALQGDSAESVMRDLFGMDLSEIPYMWLIEASLHDGTDVYVSRLGYTGEDGFEISVPADKARALWDKLLSHDKVKPIGLAARDSLRLEMGYCLYGHDIDDTTSPVEAGLGWVMGKENTGFIGAGHVLGHKEDGVDRQRVGIRLTEKGVAREGVDILDAQSMEKIGTLTSGGFSPSLKGGVGQGYVQTDKAESGTKVFVNVRGRNIAAEVADMPFIPARTKSMKKKAA
ncbi:MAG TPA: glycine cleavage system aminomethyltransferase GcvT [Micavibrio sp.]|nr:glycine cleavage system aminomethyltransferase GcvT [Micavibrio sp.]HIL28817.1 glycine cleavage system aminomethyltransferase GcvT [Micavibrio sp.]